jgi:hypothetical protein
MTRPLNPIEDAERAGFDLSLVEESLSYSYEQRALHHINRRPLTPVSRPTGSQTPTPIPSWGSDAESLCLPLPTSRTQELFPINTVRVHLPTP